MDNPIASFNVWVDYAGIVDDNAAVTYAYRNSAIQGV